MADDAKKKVDDPKKAIDPKKLLAEIEALKAAQVKSIADLAKATANATKAEKAIADAAKAKSESEADDAKKKGEFEKLFKAEELKVAKLEASQVESEKTNTASLAAIVKILETEKKGVLKDRLSLIPEALSPMEQLQYIHANRGVLFEKSKAGSFNADKNKSDEKGVGMKTALANLSAKTDVPMEDRVDAVFDAVAVGESTEG